MANSMRYNIKLTAEQIHELRIAMFERYEQLVASNGSLGSHNPPELWASFEMRDLMRFLDETLGDKSVTTGRS